MSALDRRIADLVTGRGAFVAALVLAAVMVAAGPRSHSLWTPDEPTGSAVGRAMFETGDYIVPRLNGRPFLEKPPLYWWAQAAAFRALGLSDAAARVPSALFSLLTLAATYGLGRRLAGPRAGVVAVAVLATTAEFNEDMTRVVVDPALACFVTVAYWGFAILAEPRSAREARLGSAAVAMSIPLAFLTKGAIAIGLGVVPPVAYLIWRARVDWRSGARRLLPVAVAGPVVFALLVVPWAALLVQRAGFAALRECLLGNTLGRFFTTEASAAYGHRQPIWYYVANGVAMTLPWILTLPAMWHARVWQRSSEACRLLLTCCALGVLLLSMAQSKRTLYLLPLLPAFAACVGWWAEHLIASFDPDAPVAYGWDRATLDVLAGVAALVPLVVFGGAIVLRTPVWLPATGYPLARIAAELTSTRLAMLALAAGVAVAVLAARFSSRARLASAPAVGGIIVSYVLVFVAYQTAGKALVDPLKNLHDLTAAVGRLAPAGAPVYAYRPSEALQAIINFDLGRTVEAVDSPQGIVDLFTRDPSARLVLAAAAVRELPPDVAGHCRYAYNETGRKASPYAIVTWVP